MSKSEKNYPCYDCELNGTIYCPEFHGFGTCSDVLEWLQEKQKRNK